MAPSAAPVIEEPSDALPLQHHHVPAETGINGIRTLSAAEIQERHAGWWRQNVNTGAVRNERAESEAAGFRRLKLGRSIEVGVPFPRGALGQLRCYKEPLDRRIPTRKQDSEVGFYTEWLSADADGVTADVSAGDVAGRSVLLTGCASLDPRRHSVLSATAAADFFEGPRLDVRLDNRRFNLLLERPIVTQFEGSWDSTRGITRLASSSAILCCKDTLQLALLCGTDLSAADGGLDAVLVPGGDPDRRGLQRLSAAAISALDGRSKQLTVAGSYRVTESGAEVDGSFESAEGTAWRGLTNPLTWNLGLSAPAHLLCSSLHLGMHGAAGQATGVSASLSPGGVEGGLSVTLRHDVAGGWRQRRLQARRSSPAPSLVPLPAPAPLLPPLPPLQGPYSDQRRRSFVMETASSSSSSGGSESDGNRLGGICEEGAIPAAAAGSSAADHGSGAGIHAGSSEPGAAAMSAAYAGNGTEAQDQPCPLPIRTAGSNRGRREDTHRHSDSVSTGDSISRDGHPSPFTAPSQRARASSSLEGPRGGRTQYRIGSGGHDSHPGAPAVADDASSPTSRAATAMGPMGHAGPWPTVCDDTSTLSDVHSLATSLEVEWRLGSEDDWITSQAPMVLLSAELRRGWVGSCAKIDMLLPL